MTGHKEGCVDDEGWYYAVDFNWLKHPPQPGAGRFKRVSPEQQAALMLCSPSLFGCQEGLECEVSEVGRMAEMLQYSMHGWLIG